MRRGIQRPRGVPTGPEFQRPIAPNPAQRSGPAGGPRTAQNTLGRPNYGPPSNIGRDRAGGFGMNDLRQLFPGPTGGSLSDLLDRRRDLPSPAPDDLPFPSYPREGPRYPWEGEDQDRTTIPEGFNPPDEYGRMRPTIPNPYEGGKIGGGWDDYEPTAPGLQIRVPLPYGEWERYGEEMRPMGEAAYMRPNPWGEEFPLPPGRPPIGTPWGGGGIDIATSDEYRRWNSIRRKYGEEVANQMMGHVTANRGGIMGLI